jgi:hypothetical protein
VDWRKLLNEELNDQHFSLNIVPLKISRTVRLVGYLACMEERRVEMYMGFWLET